mgnify:CR=1 FL=1
MISFSKITLQQVVNTQVSLLQDTNVVMMVNKYSETTSLTLSAVLMAAMDLICTPIQPRAVNALKLVTSQHTKRSLFVLLLLQKLQIIELIISAVLIIPLESVLTQVAVKKIKSLLPCGTLNSMEKQILKIAHKAINVTANLKMGSRTVKIRMMLNLYTQSILQLYQSCNHMVKEIGAE